MEDKKYVAPFSYTDEELTRVVDSLYQQDKEDTVTVTGNYSHDYWDEWWDTAELDVSYWVNCTTQEDGAIVVDYGADIGNHENVIEKSEVFDVESLENAECQTLEQLAEYINGNIHCHISAEKAQEYAEDAFGESYEHKFDEDFTGTPEERTTHLEKIDKDEMTIEYDGSAEKAETKDILSKDNKVITIPEDEKKLQEGADMVESVFNPDDFNDCEIYIDFPEMSAEVDSDDIYCSQCGHKMAYDDEGSYCPECDKAYKLEKHLDDTSKEECEHCHEEIKEELEDSDLEMYDDGESIVDKEIVDDTADEEITDEAEDVTADVYEKDLVDEANEILADLIIDEKEAIEGYKKAVDTLTSKDEITDKSAEVLKHIEDEELEHIEELSHVISEKPENVVVDEALKNGDAETAKDIKKTIDYYEEKEDDQPENRDKFDDKIDELNDKLEESLQDGKVETHEEQVINGLISELFDTVGYTKDQLVKACKKAGMTNDEIDNFAINFKEEVCLDCSKKDCDGSCKKDKEELTEAKEIDVFDKVYSELFFSNDQHKPYPPYGEYDYKADFSRKGNDGIAIIRATKNELKPAENIAKKYKLEYKYMKAADGSAYKIIIFIPNNVKEEDDD